MALMVDNNGNPIGNTNVIEAKTAEEIDYDNTESGLTSDNVQGAIDEVSDNLVTHSKYELLITNITSTGTKTFSKSISTYRYIAIVIHLSDVIRGIEIIPTDLFRNVDGIIVSDRVINDYYSQIKYVSDNSVNVVEFHTASGSNNRHAAIYGIK